MKDLPWYARVYIVTTALLGLAFSAAEAPGLVIPFPKAWLLLLVLALACLTQIRKVPGPTPNSSYDLSLIVYGFALIELGLPAAAWAALVGGLFAWLWHRDYWYINVYNIGMWVISVCAAGLAYPLITTGKGPAGLLGMLLAMVLFTLVNHTMLGLVILLANGESFAASGSLDRLTLTIDATLFGMGTVAALIWRVNPYATLLISLPIYLIYTTLNMPRLRRQAESDSKTGLYNARYFSQGLIKEMERADRYDRPLSVVVSDLDFLRNINNTYGHLAGDAVLVGVAKILREVAREYDLVARFGGEEFAILLLETTPAEAYPRIEAIRDRIEAAEFLVSTSPTPLKITMSFGIAGRERSGQKPEEIIHQADLAVFEAKQKGRNRVEVFCHPQPGAPTTGLPATPSLESRLEALDCGPLDCGPRGDSPPNANNLKLDPARRH